MKTAQLTGFGGPSEVAARVEAEDPGAPGPGEISLEMLAWPSASRMAGARLHGPSQWRRRAT